VNKKFLQIEGIFYYIFLYQKSTFFSSVEEFFIGELMLAFERVRGYKTTSFFSYSFHEFAIYLIDLTILETISIGWIRDDDPFWNWSCNKVLYRESNILKDSCSLSISLGDLDHLRSYITRKNSIFATWIYTTSCRILNTQE
jgi:hypothetical protein